MRAITAVASSRDSYQIEFDDGIVILAPKNTDPARMSKTLREWLGSGQPVEQEPLPKKPTPSEEVDRRMKSDKTLGALVKVFAKKVGETEQDMINEIKLAHEIL